MIKIDDFKKPCSCRSVDLCYHNLTTELDALNAMVKEARWAMLLKATTKYKKGWHGWDDPDNLPILKNRLAEHIMKDFTPDNMIDIMNLAAMIRNQLI